MSAKTPIVTISAGVVGAGLMYLLDPIMGPRRRGILRDKLMHFSRVGKRAASLITRDAAHRVQGLVAEAKYMLRNEPVIDDVLIERVRSRLGRLVSHPGTIDVSVGEGGITLSGSVPDAEHDRLLQAVRKIRGVNRVHDQLSRRAA